MTQLTFQNIRNLGANGNQPLITNQNDFQIFDNVTLDQGQAHAQERRQPHAALARDPQCRHDRRRLQLQQQHDVELRRASRPAARSTAPPASTSPASCSATSTRRPATCSTPDTYTEKRPEFALYFQDDFRATSRLTLNLGLRWDVYPPWVEVDDRQSNFDVTTGKFVVASDDAVDRRRQGRPLPADLLEGATSVRGSASPTTSTATARRSSAAASASSGTSRPAARRRRRRRTRRSCSRRRSTPTPTAYGINLLLKDGLPPPPGVDPDAAGGRARRGRSSTSTSATRTRGSGTSTCSARSATNYMVEVAYVGSQGRQMLIKGDPNQAPPVVGVTDSNVNRPFITLAPALRTIGQVQSKGTLDYNGAAGEVPAPLREQLLVPELVHLRQGDRPELRQRRHASR